MYYTTFVANYGRIRSGNKTEDKGQGSGISMSIDANFGLKGGAFDPIGDGRAI